jgi:hypothetical protein
VTLEIAPYTLEASPKTVVTAQELPIPVMESKEYLPRRFDTSAPQAPMSCAPRRRPLPRSQPVPIRTMRVSRPPFQKVE